MFIFQHPPGENLAIFLVQVFFTLLICRLCGKILSYMKQPPVIGQIIGGIILGPSVLGQAPGYMSTIWPNTDPVRSIDTFNVVSNMGLIFFMFIMGLELDPLLLSKLWRTSIPIATSAIGFPFLVGAVNSFWLKDINEENFVEVNHTAFILFSGAGMSFTAFPVLAAILSATKLLNTPIGVQAMSCAAIDDVMAWCVLAIASSFSKDDNAAQGGYTCLLAAGFALAMFFIVRPLFKLVHGYFLRRDDEMNQNMLALTFLMLLVSAFTAEVIGIHAFFGAFIAGVICPKEGQFVHTLMPRLELLAKEFLLPLYFASSGIKTNIGSLNSGRLWGITVVVILMATLSKFIPCVLVGKLVTKRKWRFCITLGCLMNTRGLVELIALNVGRDLKILSPQLFTMLVIMAIVTTVSSSPLLWFIWQRSYDPELEADAEWHMQRVKHIPDEALEQHPDERELHVHFIDQIGDGSMPAQQLAITDEGRPLSPKEVAVRQRAMSRSYNSAEVDLVNEPPSARQRRLQSMTSFERSIRVPVLVSQDSAQQHRVGGGTAPTRTPQFLDTIPDSGESPDASPVPPHVVIHAMGANGLNGVHSNNVHVEMAQPPEYGGLLAQDRPATIDSASLRSESSECSTEPGTAVEVVSDVAAVRRMNESQSAPENITHTPLAARTHGHSRSNSHDGPTVHFDEQDAQQEGV